MTLRRQAFSGVRWTTISSLGRTALQIAQISILARLLTPADFGLLALVTSIMSFLQIFADAGISNAIIHHQDVTQEQLSSLYWLNVIVSFFLAFFVVVVSPWVAAMYGYPQLKLLLLFAGCTLAIGALAQQIRVVAQKNLKFAELAKIDLSAACVGFIVAVVAAYNDAGVYSIAIGSFATAPIGSALVWYRLADRWRPLIRFKIQEIRHFLAFGGYMIGNNLVNTFNSQIDIILGGKILGSQSIGLYSMSRDLNLRIAGVINPIVTSIGLPVMAKAQHDKALLKRVYLQTMRMTASVNFPVYIALALFAPEVVHVLLGAKWIEAIPLLRIFTFWGLVRSTGNPIGSLLLACGRADLSFKWNLALLVIMLPVIWASSCYGVSGIAFAVTGIMLLLFLPSWYFLVSPLCGAKLGEYTNQMLTPLILSVLAGGVAYVFSSLLVNELSKLVIAVILGCLLYIGLSWRFNRKWVGAMKELFLMKAVR